MCVPSRQVNTDIIMPKSMTDHDFKFDQINDLHMYMLKRKTIYLNILYHPEYILSKWFNAKKIKKKVNLIDKLDPRTWNDQQKREWEPIKQLPLKKKKKKQKLVSYSYQYVASWDS